jgi:hypothetical protein
MAIASERTANILQRRQVADGPPDADPSWKHPLEFTEQELHKARDAIQRMYDP